MRANIVFLTPFLHFVAGLNHPGLLHSNADFDRIRSLVESGDEPWATGWDKLANRANPDYEPNPQASICRGESDCTQNYQVLYRDIHAAYAAAIYWKVTGDTAYADAATRILDGWSGTLTEIIGSSDRFLAAGIYGYQYANAAEIMRDYESWSGLSAAVALLKDVFYPLNHAFLQDHNGAEIDHYWANWDLCNLCAIHAIGVLGDDEALVDETVGYFKEGEGNGAIEKAIWVLHEEAESGKILGQNQEAGRDQGHALLDFAFLGVLAQQSYNQGEDLFAYLDNRILAGAEYVFKYNTGHDVPFTEYSNSDVTQTEISDAGRGGIRPIAELIHAHYSIVKGLDASWTAEYRDLVVEGGGGAEGGGGDYGSTSGGYDQLGFGTLLYRLE